MYVYFVLFVIVIKLLASAWNEYRTFEVMDTIAEVTIFQTLY